MYCVKYKVKDWRMVIDYSNRTLKAIILCTGKIMHILLTYEN